MTEAAAAACLSSGIVPIARLSIEVLNDKCNIILVAIHPALAAQLSIKLTKMTAIVLNR